MLLRGEGFNLIEFGRGTFPLLKIVASATYGAGGKSAFNFDMLPKALRVEGSVGLVAPFFLAEFAVGLCVTYLLLMLLIFSFIC